jgi:hypothetical protein
MPGEQRRSTPPRLFGIPATRAPIVAVLRRGPSDWSHVGKWDVAHGRYQSGAWLRGNLYPQRCDLSPDGRWFCYFTLKGAARWKAGSTYVAISRLPWLTALAAWGTCGTWTRGAHFVEDRSIWQVGPADEGDATPCRQRVGIALTLPATFAVERRRGWLETADSPIRDAADLWDERRADEVRLEKKRPSAAGALRLVVSGRFAAFRSSLSREAKRIRYELISDGGVQHLKDVQWADWDASGRLLVATVDGKLQIRDMLGDGWSIRSEVDLSALSPSPSPAPREARAW